MNLLFICKYNRFRSKIAEDYFNQKCTHLKIHAKSAGIIKGSYPLDQMQVKTCRKLGISLKGKPEGISTELLKWQDAIVIVADDVPQELFEDNLKYGKNLFVWTIPDAQSNSEEEIAGIVTEIKKQSDHLIAALKIERDV